MTSEEIKNEMESIIKETTVILQLIYQWSKTNDFKCEPRFMFPKYRNGKLRISEQKLIWAFTKAFTHSAYTRGGQWHHAIATPPQEIKSGNSDFVIHDANNNPICLIEFKADCRSPRAYYKDFEKLIHDMENAPTAARYFIQLLESKDVADKIAKKLKQDNHPKKEIYKQHFLGATPNIEYRCYVLEDETTLNEFPVL